MPVSFFTLVVDPRQDTQSAWFTYGHMRLERLRAQAQRSVLSTPSRRVYYALPAIKCDHHRVAVKEIFAGVPKRDSKIVA